MVSVMNLLHGDPHVGRGGPHHPHPGPLSVPQSTASSAAATSHQRSPFAIQELLGLGNTNDGARSSPAAPNVSAVSMGHHPYHPRAPQQGFPDPGRMYFGAGFMPGAMHAMPAPPHMPMLGFEQHTSHPRNDANGQYTYSFCYKLLFLTHTVCMSLKI